MTALAVAGLSLRLGGFRLRDIDLAVAPGEVLVLLGPNGAGKSVCLEAIAGFHRPEAGRILIAGREVTHLPPERRGLAFVVQSFGLFPHLTVAQNVAMGLRLRRGPGDVAALLERFGIAALADRRPARLSPGEQQRTALARALASRPDLFLFDEPFSALDATMREGLRDELRSLLRGAGIAALFVTHDHEEAQALGDRVAVIAAGVMVQTGAAAEVFARPADRFVARFLGVETIVDGRIDGEDAGHLVVRVAGGGRLLVARRPGMPARGAVTLCLRGRDVRLAPAADATVNRLSGPIVSRRSFGPLCKVVLDCGFPLTGYVLAREAEALGWAPGQPLAAAIEPSAIHLLCAAAPLLPEAAP